MKKKEGRLEKVGKVVEKMRQTEDKILSINKPFKIHSTTLGQRAAEWLTKWVGSWPFIIIFTIYIIIWVAPNIYTIINQWDPYPFILLNLTLSILAAILLPIILMSQNIESKKDRERAQYGYAVNKKAEKEIREIKSQLDRIERRLVKK